MKIVVLISGNGSNLQALIDAARGHYEIQCVISNRPDAYGLERAKQAGIATQVIDHTHFASRNEFDMSLKTSIDSLQPGLIVLAGFMRRLGSDISSYYSERMLNIHPSLLPKYPGLHTFRKALENHDSRHGCSIHYVIPKVDCGPIIAEASFEIAPDDTIDALKTKTQALEHQLYPHIIKLVTDKKIHIESGAVFLDGKPLPAQGLQFSEKNPI